MYNDEGQYSPGDNLNLDSILEADNDLSFLNALDTRFSHLANICSPPPPQIEQTKQVVESAETSIENKSSVAKVTETINYQSTNTTVTEGINQSGNVNTSSTLLVQQQPLYCLVEHQAPSAVLLAEDAVQGMYLINGLAGAQGLVLQGGNILQNASDQHGMYLIDRRSTLQGNIMLGNCPNLVNAGSLAVSPVLVHGESSKNQLHVSLSQDAQPEKSNKEDKSDVDSGDVKNAKPAKLPVKSKK